MVRAGHQNPAPPPLRRDCTVSARARVEDAIAELDNVAEDSYRDSRELCVESDANSYNAVTRACAKGQEWQLALGIARLLGVDRVVVCSSIAWRRLSCLVIKDIAAIIIC